MLKFKTLTIRNFFSYGNQVTMFDLTTPGITMIMGENLDDTSEGKAANGVGKSVIIDALCFAVYETTLSELKSIDSVINFTNKKDMYIVVEFEKDGNEYRIERGRATKDKRGKNFSELKINGVDKTPAGGSKFVNAMIEGIIGMPYEAFCRIVVFSAINDPFLKLDAKKSREVIETLFGLTELTLKEAVLKDYIKETNAKIKDVQAKYELREQSYLRYVQQIEAADKRVSDWDISHNQQIETLNATINELSQHNFSDILEQLESLDTSKASLHQAEISQKQHNTTIEQITTQYDKWSIDRDNIIKVLEEDIKLLNEVDVEAERDLFTLIDQLKVDKRTHEATLTQLKHEKEGIQKNLDDLTTSIKNTEEEIQHIIGGTCPFCLQDFKNNEAKKVELEAKLKEMSNTLMDTESIALHAVLTNMIKETTSLEEINKQLKKANSDCSFESIDDLNKVKSNITIQTSKLEDTLKSINPHIEQYDLIPIHKKEIELLKGVISECEVEIEKIKLTIPSIYINVPRSDISKKITDLAVSKSQLKQTTTETNPHISVLEDLIDNPIQEPDRSALNELMDDLEHQKFMQKLLINKDSFVRKSLLSKSLPFLNVRLSEYLNKLGFRYKVEFTPQLTASISEFGAELEFGNMSNGQASRLNTALSFAFRDVLEQMHTPVNVCILDEILDVGLDAPGIHAAVRILKQKSRDEGASIFLISHKEEIENMFDKKLLIQMDKRFSYVVN